MDQKVKHCGFSLLLGGSHLSTHQCSPIPLPPHTNSKKSTTQIPQNVLIQFMVRYRHKHLSLQSCLSSAWAVNFNTQQAVTDAPRASSLKQLTQFPDLLKPHDYFTVLVPVQYRYYQYLFFCIQFHLHLRGVNKETST